MERLHIQNVIRENDDNWVEKNSINFVKRLTNAHTLVPGFGVDGLWIALVWQETEAIVPQSRSPRVPVIAHTAFLVEHHCARWHFGRVAHAGTSFGLQLPRPSHSGYILPTDSVPGTAAAFVTIFIFVTTKRFYTFEVLKDSENGFFFNKMVFLLLLIIIMQILSTDWPFLIYCATNRRSLNPPKIDCNSQQYHKIGSQSKKVVPIATLFLLLTANTHTHTCKKKCALSSPCTWF